MLPYVCLVFRVTYSSVSKRDGLTERKQGQRRGEHPLDPTSHSGRRSGAAMRTESWMSAPPPLLRYWIRARDERHSSRNAPVAARQAASTSVSLFPDERSGLPEFPSMRVHRQRSRRNLLCARKSDRNIRMFMDAPGARDRARGASFCDVTLCSPMIRVIRKFFVDRARDTKWITGMSFFDYVAPRNRRRRVCLRSRPGEISERQFWPRFIYTRGWGLQKRRERKCE